MLAAIVDWTALGQVAAYALAAAIAALFTGGLLLVEPGGGERAHAARHALGGLCLLACVGLVAAGLYVVFTTK
jgi:hypothetical protein